MGTYSQLYANTLLLLWPQGSEVPRPLLRAELGEADPRPCWAPGIANWQDPVALTVVEPEPALRHNTLPRPVSCLKKQPTSSAHCHVRIAMVVVVVVGGGGGGCPPPIGDCAS